MHFLVYAGRHKQYPDVIIYICQTFWINAEGEKIKKLVRVHEVTPLEGYHCRLIFEGGTKKVVDLEPYLRGPIFEAILNDKEIFRQVQVVDGTIGWENGTDIDPDVVYYDLRPAWMEELISR